MIKPPSVPMPAAPLPHARVRDWRRYNAALSGTLPAEALDGAWRGLLIAELVGAGWTDEQIAVHTLWTEYTVARIRTAMGLTANHEQMEVA
jgi:hypothetical protein